MQHIGAVEVDGVSQHIGAVEVDGVSQHIDAVEVDGVSQPIDAVEVRSLANRTVGERRMLGCNVLSLGEKVSCDVVVSCDSHATGGVWVNVSLNAGCGSSAVGEIGGGGWFALPGGDNAPHLLSAACLYGSGTS